MNQDKSREETTSPSSMDDTHSDSTETSSQQPHESGDETSSVESVPATDSATEDDITIPDSSEDDAATPTADMDSPPESSVDTHSNMATAPFNSVQSESVVANGSASDTSQPSEPETCSAASVADAAQDASDPDATEPSDASEPSTDDTSLDMLDRRVEDISISLHELNEQTAASTARLEAITAALEPLTSGMKTCDRSIQLGAERMEQCNATMNRSESTLAANSEALAKNSEWFSQFENASKLSIRKPLIESLMQIHDVVFRQVCAMESGDKPPDAFTVNLFNTVEGAIKQNGVDIIRPQPGEQQEMTLMTLLDSEDRSFFRKEGSVAHVFRCGFLDTETNTMMRKAEVSVYR